MKAFVLYDGRAVIDTEGALIMDTAETEKEARRTGINDWDGYDYIWWEYDRGRRGILSNGKPRMDLPPCNNFK